MNLKQAVAHLKDYLAVEGVPVGVEELIELTRRGYDKSEMDSKTAEAYKLCEVSSPTHIRKADA